MTLLGSLLMMMTRVTSMMQVMLMTDENMCILLGGVGWVGVGWGGRGDAKLSRKEICLHSDLCLSWKI